MTVDYQSFNSLYVFNLALLVGYYILCIIPIRWETAILPNRNPNILHDLHWSIATNLILYIATETARTYKPLCTSCEGKHECIMVCQVFPWAQLFTLLAIIYFITYAIEDRLEQF